MGHWAASSTELAVDPSSRPRRRRATKRAAAASTPVVVAGRHEVEEQAAGDGEAEPHHRGVGGAARALVDLCEPAVDSRGEQAGVNGASPWAARA